MLCNCDPASSQTDEDNAGFSCIQPTRVLNKSRNTRVGFKPAGGIRTVADAALYMQLTAQHLGAAAVHPARFRIGASSLLDDIEAVLSGAQRQPNTTAY